VVFQEVTEFLNTQSIMPPSNCLVMELLGQAWRVAEVSGLDDQHQLEMWLNGMFYNALLSCKNEKAAQGCTWVEILSLFLLWLYSVHLASWGNSSIAFLTWVLSAFKPDSRCWWYSPCISVTSQNVKWGDELFMLIPFLLSTPTR